MTTNTKNEVINLDAYYTIPEAACLASVCRVTIYQWDKRGLLRISRKAGRRPRIYGRDLKAVFDSGN